MARFITEPERKTPILAQAEVVVVGGGPAGFAATLAACKQGAKTLLLEKNGFFGGTLTSVTLGNICGLYTVALDGMVIPVVQGIAAALVENLMVNGYGRPNRLLRTATFAFDVSGMKFMMDDMLVASGANLLCDIMVVGVVQKGGKILGVLVEGKGGRGFVEGQVFIDATGDGGLLSQAGVPWEFNPEELQYPTMTFSFCNVDTVEAAPVTREKMPELHQQALAAGKYRLPRQDGGFHLTPLKGVAHCNVTKVSVAGRPVNPLDPWELTYGELEGRRQVREYERFFQDWVPGFATASVCDVGNTLGIRESRRLCGDYRLTLEDIVSSRRFDDTIACSAWPPEIHGKGADTQWIWLNPGEYYQIPYRSLYSSRCRNLLVAGCCISATHEAQASVRVAGVSLATGEAAGTAAALACREGKDVAQVAPVVLQERLKDQGVFLGESYTAAN
jgi:hypothetical protein